MDSQSYLIFSLGDARYGVEALLVQELFFLPQLTPVAEAPPAIAGIVRVRGEILSVINLERFLRCKPRPYSITDSVIVLAQGDRRVGILVHQVHEIQTISADQVVTDWAGRSPISIPTATLTGVTQINDQLVFLLNAASLFGYLHASAPPVSSSEASATMVWLSLAQASGNTIASAVPWKSSSTSRAYSFPVFLLICRLTAVTTAPTLTGCSLHSPRVALVRVPNSSTSSRNRSSG